MRSNKDIQEAVDAWCGHPDELMMIILQPTNMSFLFEDETNFYDDISRWDVSLVINMMAILCSCCIK